MELVKVRWFNKLKGFGEGTTSDGRTVFLHYTALSPNGSRTDLEPDQEVYAELALEGERLIARTLQSVSRGMKEAPKEPSRPDDLKKESPPETSL